MNGQMRRVAAWFSMDSSVKEMTAGIDRGLKIWEEEAVKTYFPSGARVLDIGCGPGREAFALHAMGFTVTGVDIAGEQIAAANARKKAVGAQIEFLLVESLAYPFADASFECAIMWAQAFGNLYGEAAQLALLAECERLLVPGGVVCVSRHDRDFLAANYPQYVRDDLFYPYGEDGCRWETFTAPGLSALMEKAGFRTLHCGPGAVYAPEDGTVLYCAAQKYG